MCILNHYAAHIYLCGDVRRTVYGQNFGIYADRYTFHYPGKIFRIYVDRDTFHYLGKIFEIYVDRDTFHYPKNSHTYVQPV